MRNFGKLYIILSLVSMGFFAFKFYPLLKGGPGVENAPAEKMKEILSDVPQLEKIVESVPGGMPAANVGVGILYMQKGKNDDAERVFKKALEKDPENADAWLQLGVLYRKQSRMSEAEDALKRSLAKRPNLAFARNELGLTLDETGKHDEAIGEYEKALALDPENEILKTNLKRSQEDLDRQLNTKTEELPFNPPPPAADPGVHIDVEEPLQAETFEFQKPLQITLANGRKLTGDIVEKDEEYLWLQVAGGMKTRLSRSEVERIEDAESSPA